MRSLFLLFFAFNLTVTATPQLEFAGSIPASSVDCLRDSAGSFGSGIAYDHKACLLYLTTDRGPSDGKINFAPRLYSVPLKPDGNPVESIRSIFPAVPHPVQPPTVHLYRDSDGNPFTGLIPDSPDPEPRMKDGRRCLDPEGLSLMPDGSILVSEEYYPSILQFKPDGTFIRRFVPPHNYLPRNPTTEGVNFGEDADRKEGREDNRGFEGVALSPDAKLVYAILQSGLTQDGGKNSGATRLLVFDAFTGSPKSEYAIRFTEPTSMGKKDAKVKKKNLSFTDITFLSDGRLAAIERDNHGQDGSSDSQRAVLKQILTLDFSHATDLLSLPDKPYSVRSTEPKFKKLDDQQKIRYVKTTLLFDFQSLDLPSHGLSWEQLPEKWEGITILSEGRLLVICDNDFLTPELSFQGKKIPFPKCKSVVDTWLFTVKLR